MNISPVNNINFGRKAVLSCTIKTKENEKKYATLYSLNHKDPNDREDVRSDKSLANIRETFLRFSTDVDGMKFYVLKDNETDETIASAQTSRRYNPFLKSKYKGSYTSIDEMDGNTKYFDSTGPILGKIAKDAYEHYDKNVITAFGADNRPYFDKYRFSKTEDDTWVLPEKRYKELFNRVEQRNQIYYYG